MPKKTMFGQILNRVRYERQLARSKAEADLWERNKLANPKQRSGHKIEYHTELHKNGKETVVAQLWKRIDEEAISIELDIKTEVLKQQSDTEWDL